MIDRAYETSLETVRWRKQKSIAAIDMNEEENMHSGKPQRALQRCGVGEIWRRLSRAQLEQMSVTVD